MLVPNNSDKEDFDTWKARVVKETDEKEKNDLGEE